MEIINGIKIYSPREARRDFENEYTVVINGKDTHLLYLDEKNKYVFGTKRSVGDLLSDSKVEPEKGKYEPMFNYCFSRADKYRGLICDPDKPQVKGNGRNPFNFWRGWSVTPAEGNIDPYLHLVREVICCGNEEHFQYLQALIADMFQNPGDKPGVCIVLRGPEGNGKGMFANILGSLMNPSHYFDTPSPNLLTGRFGGHFSGKLLVFADEAFWAGDKKGTGVLKSLITEKELYVEPKYREPIKILNLCHFILVSNSDWIVPAGPRDRRYFVLDVNKDYEKDFEYFGSLDDWRKDEKNLAAILHYFLNFELSANNNIYLRNIPQTAALIEQKIESADPIRKFWFEAVEDGELFEKHKTQGFLLRKDIYKDYKDMCKDAGITNRVPSGAFWTRTYKILPQIKNLTNARERKSLTVNGKKWKQESVVHLPTLDEAREAVSENFSLPPDHWDDK